MKNVWNGRCTMSDSSPAYETKWIEINSTSKLTNSLIRWLTSHSCLLSNELRCRWRQADRHDVLLKFHISIELDERNIVLEIARRIVRMNFFSLDEIFLVRHSLVLIFHVVLAQTHFQICIRRCGDAMSCSHHPSEKRLFAMIWRLRFCTSHLLFNSAPPQLNFLVRNPVLINATCHGCEPKLVGCPPTIRLDLV